MFHINTTHFICQTANHRSFLIFPGPIQQKLRADGETAKPLARIFHAWSTAPADMGILPGVLGPRTLRRTVQVRLGVRVPPIARLHAHLHAFVTPIHEISGLGFGTDIALQQSQDVPLGAQPDQSGQCCRIKGAAIASIDTCTSQLRLQG